MTRRGCWWCSIGSCRRSAIRSPISPINACIGGCRATSEFRGLAGVDRAELGLPTEREYVADYCRRLGVDGVPHWPFLIAFSFFRFAAIAQGVYKRALDGNASNPQRGVKFGPVVAMLAKWAMAGGRARLTAVSAAARARGWRSP